MATRIYTKTGDKGLTSLIGGTRISKAHLRIESYGTVDELNAYIGLCKDVLKDQQSRDMLMKIQEDLFVVGALLACDPGKEIKMQLPAIGEKDIALLETAIDSMDAALPAMKNFILPGGDQAVSYLHIARCVCRRAERCCVRLSDEEGEEHVLILQYLNRLSDYLFVLTRYTGQLLGIADTPWHPRSPQD